MADDGIKLTDDEREMLRKAYPTTAMYAAVESIVAARVQALTAEVERLKRRPKHRDFELVELSRDAARAELAAANTRADAAEAELEQAWETVKAGYADLGDSTERLTAVIERLASERNRERFGRAALSARLEQVRALVKDWNTYASGIETTDVAGVRFGKMRDVTRILRAALGEDA